MIRAGEVPTKEHRSKRTTGGLMAAMARIQVALQVCRAAIVTLMVTSATLESPGTGGVPRLLVPFQETLAKEPQAEL